MPPAATQAGPMEATAQEGSERAAADDATAGCSDDHGVVLDGGDEDEVLSQSVVLSQAEVVKRRRRRIKQLVRLYRSQYWGLLEELRSKYRRFYLLTGKSGWREDGDNEEEMQPQQQRRRQHLSCAFQDCKLKPLPLTSFCFSHVLLDPKQCLYKPCAFIIRAGANETCGKPVLRARSPSFCTVHFQVAQKQASRLMKKGSLGVSLPPLGALAGKAAPKLHVLITEYVRAIQAKRRARTESAH